MNNENTQSIEPLRARVRRWFFREIFATEYRELQASERCCDRLTDLLTEERAKHRRPPARIAIAAEMTEQQIADRLAGTVDSPVTKAFMAKLAAKLIELTDRGMDAPRAEMVNRDGSVSPAFTEGDRLHVCGGAAHLADFLRELQESVKSRNEDETASRAA